MSTPMPTGWHDHVRAALARERAAALADESVVEELAQHAEAAHEAALAEGLDEQAAVAQVRAMIDGWCSEVAVAPPRPRRAPQVEPPAAATRGVSGLTQDARFAVRLLRRHPGFSIAAGATLAIGVAAATLVFSLVRGVLLRPLPWSQPEQLVRLSEARQDEQHVLPPLLTNGTYRSWSERHDTLQSLAAWSSETATFERGTKAPDRVGVVDTTASLFPLLHVRPLLGRAFATSEEEPGRDRVAVLSFAAWKHRFGGDRAVVGSRFRLDGQTFTVIGVMPAGFGFPNPQAELWVPLFVPPVAAPGSDMQSVMLLDAVGRLAPGATAAQAAAEGTARARAAPPLRLVGMAMFGSSAPPSVVAESLLEAWTGEVRQALFLLLAAVGLLAASAVVNVAGMQLARALSRRDEIAVRAAVGAGRGRIARQLLVESAALGLLAGGCGLLLAWWMQRLLPLLAPPDFPRLHEVRIDGGVAGFALALSLATGLVLGLFPVLLMRGRSLAGAFAADGELRIGGARLSVARGRALIMGAQVAMALVLLVGAGLLVRSFRAQWTADRGFEPRNLLTARVPMPGAAGPARQAALERLVARLDDLPTVSAAAVSNTLPLVHTEALIAFRLQRVGEAPVQIQAGERIVTPGYFRALGMHTVEGRTLLESDGPGAAPVVVVNRAFVRAYLHGDAIDSVLPIYTDAEHPQWKVVGVVDDVRQHGLMDPPRPEIYLSYRQQPQGIGGTDPIVLVRTTDDPRRHVADLRAFVREVAPSVALDSVLTMEERLSSSLARPRLYALLLGTFALLAVLVTAVGLFGVLSYTVAQRTRELGVRTALGATPAEAARLVLRQCLAVTAAGIAGGLAIAFALRGSIAGLLFGVGPADPVTWLLAPALLLLIALGAGALPAWRAARLDPLRALRS